MGSTRLGAESDATSSGNRAGIFLAFLQLIFTLGWTPYVIYLPALAKEVGIAPGAVIFILMLDQAIFTITDTIMGLVFSALALATFARMAAVAGGLQKMPDYAPLLQWAPVACWAVAGAGLLVIAAARMQRKVSA